MLLSLVHQTGDRLFQITRPRLGVACRRIEIAVSQQHLHRHEILARVEQVLREGVTQRVWPQGRQSGALRVLGDEHFHPMRREWPPLPEEDFLIVVTVRSVRTHRQPRRQRLPHLVVERHEPFFVPLAPHAEVATALPERGVLEGETDEFADAQAGMPQGQDDRQIAQPISATPIPLDGPDQPVDLALEKPAWSGRLLGDALYPLRRQIVLPVPVRFAEGMESV